MTPQFEAAIAAVQMLSSTERQKLLQILTQSHPFSNPQADLKAFSIQFWQDTTLKQLLATQSPTTINDLNDLAADFWPEEDRVEDFLTFLRQQRQEVI